MRYRFGEFVLDERTCELHGPTGVVPLERRVFDLLAYLVRNSGRLLTKGDIYREIWCNRVVSEASLSVAMTALRRAIGDDGVAQRLVATHHGRGYRFVAPVSRISDLDSEESPPSVQIPFVGRVLERAAIRATLNAARNGRLSVALITGEAGIGKTRLIGQIAGELETEGFTSLVGRCSEQDGAPAYWPWIQVLRQEFSGWAPTTLRPPLPEFESLGQLLPEFQELFGRRGRIDPVDPSYARFRLFDAISTCLDRSAKRRPTVVFLDDIHRADEASLLLLAHLGQSIGDSPLAIIATHRDVSSSSPLARTLASLARAGHAQNHRLAGFDLAESAELLRGIANQEISLETTSLLRDRTSGNPLFLVHLAQQIRGDGIVDPDNLPSDLLAAIAIQIDELPPEAREFLQAVAVAGTETTLDILGEVLGWSIDRIVQVTDDLQASRVVDMTVGPTPVQFRHALLRDCLYQSMSPARRAILHARVARALVRSEQPDPRQRLTWIAHHYFHAAATGTLPQAIEYAIKAAELSAACFAYEDSAAHYRRALEIISLSADCDREIRASLLLQLGTQLTRAGDRAPARSAFRDALHELKSAESSRLLAETALSVAPGVLALESGIVDTFLIELLEEALNACPAADSGTRARLLSRLSLALHWGESHEIPAALADQASIHATASADPEAIALALQACWSLSHGPQHVAQRATFASRLASPECAGATPETMLVSHVFALYSALERGELNALAASIRDFSTLAHRLNQPQALWYSAMIQGMRALLVGDFAGGERMLNKFSAIGSRVGDANAVHSGLAHAAYLAFERGTLSALLPAAQDIAARFPSVQVWKAALAWMFALCGRMSDASRALGSLRLDRSGLDATRMDTNGMLCLAGEAVALIGDKDLASLLYHQIKPLRSHYIVLGLGTLCWGSADRVLGILAESMGKLDDAVAHLTDAIAREHQLNARAWLAHSHFALARVSARMFALSDTRVHEQIAAAFSLADEHGMTGLLTRLAEFSPRPC